MNWDNLSERSKDYVNRYIRNKNKTIKQALQEKMVQEVINEYETEKQEMMV